MPATPRLIAGAESRTDSPTLNLWVAIGALLGGGKDPRARRSRARGSVRLRRMLQVRRCFLAAPPVGLHLEGNLLSLDEAPHAGGLQSGRMDEYVLAAVIRLNEAKALLCVVELNCACGHGNILSLTRTFARMRIAPVPRSRFGKRV